MAEKKKLTPTQKRKRRLKITYSILLSLLIVSFVFMGVLYKNGGKSIYKNNLSKDNICVENSDEKKVDKNRVNKEVSKNKEVNKIDNKRDNKIDKKTVVKNKDVGKKDSKKKKKLVFVIDDCGLSLENLKLFLKIPGKVTFAIMPQRRFSFESDEILYNSGQEIILHQPMEAKSSSADPGVGAIYEFSDYNYIYKTLTENLKSVPHAIGINNHMGSKATSNLETMKIVCSYLKERDMFFLDSKTASSSVVPEAAKSVGLNYLVRNAVFLDNEKSREYILSTLESGLKTAERDGYAIMIGHLVTQELARILIEFYPELEKSYELCSLEALLGDF